VTPGPLGAGFHCSENGAVVDARGRASESIFNLGPARLGDLLESIAVPEIREQAVDLAFVLKERVNQMQTLNSKETLRVEPVDEWVAA
jgi:hydroxyacylglutathione hydrolase